jgi:membrane associated rhomboid family serine protease
LAFYLLVGLAATFAQFILAPHSSVPNVGASGAIAGVLGAYILMFPQSRVNVLLGPLIVAMPAIIVLGLWIALQLFSGVGTIAYTDETADAGGVAYMARKGLFDAPRQHVDFVRSERQLVYRQRHSRLASVEPCA